ncbi:MAG: hypothetical protein FWG96_06715 [Methanomassiliicoccaceae archaeon]|nr:hypothetical protein [Methanomassiliicoccaceae archaeon]
MATSVETNLGKKIGIYFRQMNIGDNDEEQKTLIMSFSEGNVYVDLKILSHFNREKWQEISSFV